MSDASARGSRRAPPETRSGREIAIIVAVGLAVRLLLIYRYPMIFGGDTIARLAKADEHLVQSHQLPLLDAAIHALHLISSGPLPVQVFMALVGAVAGAGFYLVMTDLARPEVAFDASLLFVANPLILADSIVPYQEILMLAGLLFAFHFALTDRWVLASASLGLACLTRYEAWLACPVITVAYLRKTKLGPAALLKALVLFGWGPLGWMAFARGVTPAGSYAIEWSSNPERLLRWVHLAAVTARNTALPTLLLAIVGVAELVRHHRITPAYHAGIAFGALFLLALLFSAHGIPPHRETVVTEREAHIPLTAVTLLAGLGLALLPRARHVITGLGVLVGLWMAERTVRGATSEPHVALSYQVAQYIEHEIPVDEEVAVLARGINAEVALARVEQLHGREAVRPFLATLTELQMQEPPDYERIRVQSDRGQERLRSYASLLLGPSAGPTTTRPVGEGPAPHPAWIVLWSDFAPTNATEATLAEETHTAHSSNLFRQDSVWVALYALGPAQQAR